MEPKRGGEGGLRTVRTAVLEEAVLDAVAEDSSISVRKLSAQFNTSKSVVHRILKEQLLHPFHIQKVHAMSPADYPARVQYAHWFLQKQQEDRKFIGSVLFTDEAGFRRDGVINSHNVHSWNDENPHIIIQTHHQRQFQINVWAGIIGNYLIGPFVLENRLNGENYLRFLQENLDGLLEDVPLATIRNMTYMHDGAPPHFSITVREYLDQKFSHRWIGRGGPVPWPPRSPDLNPLDFFFWGHLKNLVYKTPVQTREEMLQRITTQCEAIRNNPGMLFQVQRSNLSRLRECILVRGAHIEHLL